MSKSSMEVSNLGGGGGGGGGVGGDEFYEDIEAPKFVDFTAPDRYSPDTDRYWFCLRVGCDQKHEEQLDAEAVYKNFVLRVLAARSPNLRLHKALTRKPINSTAKCPMSAPAKPSRSRLPRMAILSSISGKTFNCGKERVKSTRPVATTPNTKAKQPSNVAKALTTPRNNKRVSNPELFRSVRDPKVKTIAGQNKRLVAKALAFPSPKKAMKSKISSELDTTVRKICAGMKKLEIAGQKRNILGYDTPAPLGGSKKKMGAREVKSRVFDSLRTQKCKGADKASRCLKKKETAEDLKNCSGSATIEGTSGDSSDMDVDHKSTRGSLEACLLQETSQNTALNVHEELLTNVSTSEKKSGESIIEGSSSTVRVENADEGLGLRANVVPTVQAVRDEERTELTSQVEDVSSLEEKIQENTGKTSDQSDVPANDEEIVDHVIDNDNKENSMAPDHNIEQNGDCNRKILEKLDNHEKYEKVTRTLMKIKKSSIADKRSGQGGKYVKPKPTNPKPFRLRTDERRILKEANHEKKLSTPLKENATSPGFPSKKNIQKRIKAPESIISQREVGQKMAASTPDRYIMSKQQKNIAHAVLRSRESTKKTRILSVKRLEGPGSAPSRRKEVTCQLSVIKETSAMDCDSKEAAKIRERGASSATKPTASGTSRSLSRARRRPTIPKEPNFHDIHVPKSCIKKLT
ncbi:uncharacterized protein LOC115735776 isoform X2 [Rhodamnia argentea]|uniref:Uncharacterized protein LOC115735776 isoform X2 n=1 Tax=Rhodamnia argentea TaxID=178133 RepID=A0A8B8NLL2_9MYRT|nr:uncharacterized protein LOC115735776 isoform X2 [Rhodamnia argentea]